MRRLLLPTLFLLASCASNPDAAERTSNYPAGPPGAYLSFQLHDPAHADDLMTKVQSTLLAHPEWAGQTMSHGFEPPSGYFYNYKGRCATPLSASVAIERLMKEAGAGAPRCREVGY